MNLKPILQKKLFGHGKIFSEIIDLINEGVMPNKILLSGPKGSGKSTIAYHLINYIFSKDEEFKYNYGNHEINHDNRSFKLLLNGSHPNFYLIDLLDDKKNIEINQIRKMIEYTNKSTFNNLSKYIMIDNVENLNINSANALLKIVEEYNEKIYFILIHNNKKKIISTLKSRCLNYKINLSFHDSIKITNNLINNNIYEVLNDDLINHYNTPGDYINLVNFALENKINLKDFLLKDFLIFIINNNYYKKNNFIKSHISNFIESYFLSIYNQSIHKNKILSLHSEFITKFNNTKNFNLDFENFFMEFKSKILNG